MDLLYFILILIYLLINNIVIIHILNYLFSFIVIIFDFIFLEIIICLFSYLTSNGLFL
jgi:hypothetical protein